MKTILLAFLLLSQLAAAPAYPGKRQFQQPDGTVFTARQKGDEYLHWYETDEGDVLLYNKKEKRFEYAVIKEKKLLPSGEAFRKSTARKSAGRAQQPKVDKKALHRLWHEKRDQEIKRRSSPQESSR
jgi:hypothetical protein